MIANYHTHTWRACTRKVRRENMWKGPSRAAEDLGFSDHTPMPYANGYVSNVKAFKPAGRLCGYGSESEERI